MHSQRIINRSILFDTSILVALKRMDNLGVKSLLVFKEEMIFSGVLSIGDIQRAILKNVPLDRPVNEILRTNPRVATVDTPFDKVKSIMMQFRMEFLPIVDEQNHVTNIFIWDEVFGVEQALPSSKFNLPVVVMAGGQGSRLKPLTNVLPKPLIPLNEKTILEEIFERFFRYGCNRFYLSLNYKAELIEFYLKNLELPYQLTFFRENKPMGTAGSLALLKSQINETFFVTNCDILIEQDYSEILQYHRSNANKVTIVAALKHYPIPYGVLDTGENGQLLNLQEKPELIFKINSGMYILEREVLNEIPYDSFFHITQLIEIINQKNGRIGVFPVSEKSWKDIGNTLNHFMK